MQAQDVGTAGLNPQTAKTLRPVVQLANRTFTRMPQVQLTSRLVDLCGGGPEASLYTRYCTDLNTIYFSADLSEKLSGQAISYLIAHQYARAVQVRHGIADIALSRIKAEPANEAALRVQVSAQAACVAGVLLGRAKIEGISASVLADDPFGKPHWGHSPISNTALSPITTAERDRWFATGHRAKDFAVCATKDFDARLILRAEQ